MLKILKANSFYCLILALFILVAYHNSFHNAFQYDDFHVIIKNPAIKTPANYHQFFFNPELGSGTIKETSGYRPLLMASFALNYYLGGLEVFGYHLTNFFLHALCAFLVFFITLFFLQLSPDGGRFSPQKNQWTALFAALIFAVHPAQTESVTYITGRSNLLTAAFFLAAFWAYGQYALSGKVYQLFLSCLSFACALLVKETAVALLLILAIFNFLFPLGRNWKGRIFSFLPHIFLSLLYLIIRVHLFGTFQYNSKPLRPLYDNLLTQTRAWVHYLGTLLVPLNLNVDYDFPISHSFWESGVLLSIFILTLLIFVVWKISQSSRPVGFFALWFAINLLPTNSLIPLEDVVTDRWLYLPSIGFAVIVALAVEWIYRAKVAMKNQAWKLTFFFLCALVVELYCFATTLRNFTWASYWTLWEDAVDKSPNKARPHVSLGLALNGVGRTQEAIEEFKIAIHLNPKAGEAYLNLGYIYCKQGKIEEAIEAFKTALTLGPFLAPEAHNNLGIAYLQQGRIQEAKREFELSLKARPLYARPYFNLSKFYENEGKIDLAISYMEKAAQLEPEFVLVHQALSRLYESKGWNEKNQEAQRNFLKYDSLGRRVFLGG
jgi:tetratricopeptide (TPR) repeat protein